MKPVILCILDGVGQGDGGPGDAVAAANTPHLDRLRAEHPWTLLKAHGKAVGLPTDKDMGNSEVGHNALGAGRVFDQGAKLVDKALESGTAWGETWDWLTSEGTLHILGLLRREVRTTVVTSLVAALVGVVNPVRYQNVEIRTR